MKTLGILVALLVLGVVACAGARPVAVVEVGGSESAAGERDDATASLFLKPIASLAPETSSLEAGAPLPSAPTAGDPVGVAAVDVVVGEPTELPEGMALVIETGCWHCDGSTEALYRVSRPVGGATEVLKLFEADRSAFANAYITSFAMRPDASEMVVAVCTRGYCGGLGFPTSDARVTFYRSTDSGMNWSPLGVSGEARQVIAVTDAGIVVGPGAGPDYSKVWLVNGTPVAPPAGAEGFTSLSRRDGEVLWWDGSSHRLLRGDGSLVLSLPQSQYGPDVATNPNQPPLAFWASESSASDPTNASRYYLTVQALDGTQVGLRLGVNSAAPVQWLDERHIVATVELETTVFGRGAPPQGFKTGLMTPSIVDIYSGLVRPIAGLAGTDPFLGRNRVQAVYSRGAGAGCLPVHDRWTQTATVLACAAPRTLAPTGERRYGDAREWRGVWLADGRAGWVEASLLR